MRVRLLLSRAACALLAGCIAVPAGSGLMWTLGRLFDLAPLPVFNPRALLHASAIVAWPARSLLIAVPSVPLTRFGQGRLQLEQGTR